jgi:hypothetical protein
MIKQAADGQKRNLSNFIEIATLQYLSSIQFVDSEEMSEILADKQLYQNLKDGLDDIKKENYTLV